MITFLPVDSKARKDLPVATGVVDYFPLALVAIAELSRKGNDKHNPGEPLHWARGKGGNNSDELMRHFIERGTIDPDDNVRHSTKVAWRALALLQLELEAAAEPKAECNECGAPRLTATCYCFLVNPPDVKIERPSQSEIIDARLSNDPCGFAVTMHPGAVYVCSCGATVRPGEDRPDECRNAKSNAPPKPPREQPCGFDREAPDPGRNVTCRKCSGIIGDGLRPVQCKHWITDRYVGNEFPRS